ncbi:MAG: hypothetical protein OEW58_01400 [Gammaproteobacteria bacterium]|nr:hypothetical protein [Gammaproteobacteria bacterium]
MYQKSIFTLLLWGMVTTSPVAYSNIVENRDPPNDLQPRTAETSIEPAAAKQLQQLQLELLKNKQLELELLQQNQMLKADIQAMEKMSSDIAQQLGLLANIRQQQTDGRTAQAEFIDQTLDNPELNKTVGGISMVVLLIAGMAFRHRLGYSRLVSYLKNIRRSPDKTPR